jgi:hypothetical protein
MAENKTQPTDASVASYLDAIIDDARRKDCRAIADLMQAVTRCPPVMWGAGIVGFGSYHYRYASGREGDACVTGFASRKTDISVYLGGGGPDQEKLLAVLGRHKMGKSCLSIGKLADVDIGVLERLIRNSVAGIKQQYG